MLIISDTSPITNLLRVGKLEILKELYGEVIVPQKVYEELCNYENQKELIDGKDWIVVRTVMDIEQVKSLLEYLDVGEAEAIILAKEMKADLLIVDEKKGRKTAEEYGLKIIGILGVLVEGKRKGYIAELKPILDKLKNEVGFRMSERLYKGILKAVNEVIDYNNE